MVSKFKFDYGISIIIPTIGRRTIHNLIKSIHEDITLKEHELIVVGSLDVIGKLRNLVKTYPCVKLIEQNILDVSTSRNIGIEQAKMKLVSLIDDDDVWLNKRTQVFKDAINGHATSIVFGSAIIFEEKLNKISYYIKQKTVCKKDLIRQFKRPFFLKQKLFLQVGNCAFLNNDLVPKFRENLIYLEDQIWIFDALISNFQIRQVKDITVKYNFSRLRSNSRWSIYNEVQIFRVLNELSPNLGASYISNVSLKSQTISAKRHQFISAKKALNDNFSFGISSKLKFLALSCINYFINLKPKLF